MSMPKRGLPEDVEPGDRLLLLKTSGSACLACDPATGERRYRPADRLERVEDAPVALDGDSVPDTPTWLAGNSRAVGLVVELVSRAAGDGDRAVERPASGRFRPRPHSAGATATACSRNSRPPTSSTAPTSRSVGARTAPLLRPSRRSTVLRDGRDPRQRRRCRRDGTGASLWLPRPSSTATVSGSSDVVTAPVRAPGSRGSPRRRRLPSVPSSLSLIRRAGRRRRCARRSSDWSSGLCGR